MISKKTRMKSFSKDRYYIDLNELQYKSRSRLYYVFDYIVRKELDWTDEQVREAHEDFGKRGEFPVLIKSMNGYIKDLVVFYYGPGDNATEYSYDVDPNKGIPKKKIVRKKRKKKERTIEEVANSTTEVLTTQQKFEARMREQIKADDERVANSKRRRKKGKK